MLDITTLNNFTYSALLFYCVFLTKTLISHYIPHNPWFGFSRYCSLLSNKVNKSSNSASQQAISGVISVWVTFAPLIVILWLFADFIEVIWLWHALLLYLALGSCELFTKVKSIELALSVKNTDEAKKQLSPLTLRETQSLSSVGLSKACIEMLIGRSIQHYFVIAFYFFTFNALAAISIRLLLEMHYSWNVKSPQHRNFGKHIQQIVNILQWIPVRLLAFTMLIIYSLRGVGKLMLATKDQLMSFNNNIIYHYLSLNQKITLGGAAIYEGEKLRRDAFNKEDKQPEHFDIVQTVKQIKILLFLLSVGIILTALSKAL